ncbi:MAG: outer membrane beta-barrel protein [Sphingobium sp.]|jgi:outer membrane protein|nr:outer membrane beta-barrel protein [Sphingobium sp.]
MSVRLVSPFAVGMLAAAPAYAEDSIGWHKGDIVIRAGGAGVFFNSSAEVKVAGNVVPGGSVSLSNNATASGELEYFVTSNISLAANFGIPPETRITGAGTLAPLGVAGRVRYGFGDLVARYHVGAAGRFSPFAGLGVGRIFVFSTRDGSVSGLSADSAWAPVVQGGADFHLNRQISLYANVSYVPVKTDARGLMQGLPMTARVTLNPTVVQAGLSYRF